MPVMSYTDRDQRGYVYSALMPGLSVQKVPFNSGESHYTDIMLPTSTAMSHILTRLAITPSLQLISLLKQLRTERHSREEHGFRVKTQ